MNFKYKVKSFIMIFCSILFLDYAIFTSEKSERRKIWEEEEFLWIKNTDKKKGEFKAIETAVILSSEEKSDLKDHKKIGNRNDIYQEVEDELLKK